MGCGRDSVWGRSVGVGSGLGEHSIHGIQQKALLTWGAAGMAGG